MLLNTNSFENVPGCGWSSVVNLELSMYENPDPIPSTAEHVNKTCPSIPRYQIVVDQMSAFRWRRATASTVELVIWPLSMSSKKRGKKVKAILNSTKWVFFFFFGYENVSITESNFHAAARLQNTSSILRFRVRVTSGEAAVLSSDPAD